MNLMGQPLRVGQHVHSAEHRVSQRTIDFYTETFGDSHPYYTSEGSGALMPGLHLPGVVTTPMCRFSKTRTTR